MSRPKIGIFSGLAVAIVTFLSAMFAGAGAGFMAGKTPGGWEAALALALGSAVFIAATIWAFSLLRGAPRSWKAGLLGWLAVVLLAAMGPGIGMLKRSDLGRCEHGFFACIWPDVKENLRDLKDDL